jgi:hypothetical protein
LWDDEPADVKKKVEEATAEFNKERAAGTQDSLEDAEPTPEDYQQ